MDTDETIPAQYQQYIEKLGLSDDETREVIHTLRAIAANIVDEMFDVALGDDVLRSSKQETTGGDSYKCPPTSAG